MILVVMINRLYLSIRYQVIITHLVVQLLTLIQLTITHTHSVVLILTDLPRVVEVLTLIICYIIMVPLVDHQVLLLLEVVIPQSHQVFQEEYQLKVTTHILVQQIQELQVELLEDHHQALIHRLYQLVVILVIKVVANQLI